MRKTATVILFCARLFTSVGTGAVDQVPRDQAQRDLWFQNRQDDIRGYLNLPNHEKIDALGAMVRQLSRARLYRSAPEKDQIISEATADLLAIPGHAQYYVDRILKERARYEEEKKAGDTHHLNAVLDEQLYGFETLAQLPSPETVKVLCDLLDDSRGTMKPEDFTPEAIEGGGDRPVNGGAFEALMALPIRSKPFHRTGPFTRTREELQAGLDAWKQWYQEIKAGKRTFSFEGDPMEYNLNGPVRVSTGDAARPGPHGSAMPAPPAATVSRQRKVRSS